MKTILVATDFSAAALNAALYAAKMAKAIHADILLLHVFRVSEVYVETPVALRLFDIKEDAREGLGRVRKALLQEANGSLNIDTEVKEGDFFQQLKAVCENRQPYLVIIGSQGETAAERLLFGTHAAYTMQHLAFPLLAVPRNVTYSAINRIGLACDFQNILTTVPFDKIKELIHEFDAGLHVLNTCTGEAEEAESLKQAYVLQKKLGNLIPVFHFIQNDDVEEGVIDFVNKYRIDLLIVLPKHHGLMERLLYKSYTKQLTNHSHVPVMALQEVSVKKGVALV